MRVRIYTTGDARGYPNGPRRTGLGGVVAAILQQGLAALFAAALIALALTIGVAALLVGLGLRAWTALPDGFRRSLSGQPRRDQARGPRAGAAQREQGPEVIDAEFRIIPPEETPEGRSHRGD